MPLGLTLGRRHHRTTVATTVTPATTTIATTTTTTVTPAAAPVRLGVVGLAAGAELRHGELAAVVQTGVGWVRLLLWLWLIRRLVVVVVVVVAVVVDSHRHWLLHWRPLVHSGRLGRGHLPGRRGG